jgi:futalosine hydrolase
MSRMMSQNVGDKACDVLILVPSRLERELLRKIWPQERLVQSGQTIQIAECGFGVIVAAANTVRWIARYRPGQVVLLGIAGSYRDELPIGAAYRFDQVACDGIGVGRGAEFVSAEDLGWLQWSGNQEEQPIGDILNLPFQSIGHPSGLIEERNSGQRWGQGDSVDPGQSPQLGLPAPGLLLTVTSAASSAEDRQWRQEKFPAAVAEEMEGFAVAVACRLEKIPLTIIRGISNRAGDRHKANWRIAEALEKAAALCCQIIHQGQRRE